MTASLTALAVAALLMASPTTTFGQSPAAASTAAAQTPTPTGLAPAVVVEWLKAQGLAVGDIQPGNAPYVQVKDVDGLSWTVTFNSCDGQVCGDLQLSAGFSNPKVTLEAVNVWNAQRRFAKAFYEGPNAQRADGSAVLQQDVVLLNGLGPSQLADAVAVWRALLPDFALHVGYFVQDGTPPATNG